MRYAIIAAILAILTGCASAGTDYDPAAVATLQEGMTEAEVIQRMGKPNNVTTMVDGRKVMVWAHSEVNGLSGRSSTRAVSILFGADGRMSRQVSETNTQGSFGASAPASADRETPPTAPPSRTGGAFPPVGSSGER